MTLLQGRRVVLRPLVPGDFTDYSEVRKRNGDWLTKWEPARLPAQPDPADAYDAFVARCSARQRERQLGTGYGFGIFCGSTLCGEINLSSVQRGAFQSGSIGYWVDRAQAGNGYCPEAVVVVSRYAFEDLALHRLQIAIIPRNSASRRVVEKLELRSEGVAIGYLQINGRWEDHIRFALTAEEWRARGDELTRRWL
jgi:ribosomal-protein-alanine N-acetyltransferase